MISCDRGSINCSGTNTELMTDLTIIIKSFLEHKITNEDGISHCLQVATMSIEEVKANTKELLKSALDKDPSISEICKKIVDEVFGE